MSRSYIEAASVLQKVLVQKNGLKTSLYNAKTAGANKQMIYKLVTETLKYADVLRTLINETPLKDIQHQVKLEMLLIMLYEHLFGQGIRGGGLVSIMSLTSIIEILKCCVSTFLHVHLHVHR